MVICFYYLQDWHIGVRSIKTNALLACITGIPAEIRVHDRCVLGLQNLLSLSFSRKPMRTCTHTHSHSHSHSFISVMKMCEINFLCVHKKLRSKRLAPVLIKEVTRRVNLLDVWQVPWLLSHSWCICSYCIYFLRNPFACSQDPNPNPNPNPNMNVCHILPPINLPPLFNSRLYILQEW